MTLPDGGEVDAALVAYLLADATLAALLPDGVWMDEATAAKRFIALHLAEHLDEGAIDGDAFQVITYDIQAIGHSHAIDQPTMESVAAALYARLHGAHIPVPGYPAGLSIHRQRRIRDNVADPVSKGWYWYHRGGIYLAHAS